MARPRNFDERQVLGSVREQFWDRGYTATSVSDLMEVTGLGKGSLYGAFGDKRQLFLRTLDEYRAEQFDAVRGALEGPGTALERLTGLLEGVSDGYRNDAQRRGCLLANSTSELHGQDPDVVSRARSTYQAVEDLLVACVEEAQRDGDLDRGTEARELGRLLLSVLQGIEFLAKTGMDGAALKRIGNTVLALLPRT
ncbi:TetR/AcrR family transcriptional regulator [Streptacidiphilus sp. ASG 303]|uniref:TetR/AcrR family transcriptional regulator n=1 Tax=Streptacidiphilus sp. ASG 303 TaxID=2896847 RepID=UPI001E618239|nr:TetR/AcrR family transcriptional regulator [Streptacidiphilus sp. ASG 303]MCD0484137.1 TetR/AcrR family transcriptional regulator [Streptacidiphilus sp. ASG 303]